MVLSHALSGVVTRQATSLVSEPGVATRHVASPPFSSVLLLAGATPRQDGVLPHFACPATPLAAQHCLWPIESDGALLHNARGPCPGRGMALTEARVSSYAAARVRARLPRKR